MSRRYVIVGAGIAGVTAAEAVRRQDPTGEILLLSRERELPYSRPLLSKAPLLSLELKRMALHDAAWYRELGIDLRLGVEAEALDPAAHSLICGGQSISYDRCVLATGAYNFIPPFAGRDEVEICDIRTLEDLRRVRRLSVPGGRAVVIGGGVIGLEMAAELGRYGMEVTVLEAMDRLMPRLIDSDTSDWLKRHLHLRVETGVNIALLRREGRQTVVEEADGRAWSCDLLLVSCGVRADIGLAQKAGIPCGRAILVNERMETGAADVWACGDCASFRGFNAALWSQGLAQGRVAGTNAAGGSAVYSGCDTSLTVMMDKVGLFALGDLGQAGGDYRIEESDWPASRDLLVDPRRPSVPGHGRKVWKDGKLVGVALLGDLTRMYAWKKLLLEGGPEL